MRDVRQSFHSDVDEMNFGQCESAAEVKSCTNQQQKLGTVAKYLFHSITLQF